MFPISDRAEDISSTVRFAIVLFGPSSAPLDVPLFSRVNGLALDELKGNSVSLGDALLFGLCWVTGDACVCSSSSGIDGGKLRPLDIEVEVGGLLGGG